MKSNFFRPLLIFAALLFLTRPSFAQAITNQLSPVFELLETDRVPSGFLLDAAIEYSDLRKYNGTLTSDNYSDLSVFRNILATLDASVVNSNAAHLNANAMTDNLADSVSVNLGAALFKYNYIVSNALSSGLIAYQGGKLYDVYLNGIWQNPYAEDYTFAFTPSRPCQSGTSVRYKFDLSHLYGNVTPVSIEFDAGEESNVGYRTIGSSYDATINYISPGEKTLRMKVTLSNNSVLESHSIITLLGPSTSPMSQSTVPTGWAIIWHHTDGEPARAKISYKSSHSGAIVKPFIFVEGFDNGLVGVLESLGDCNAFWNRVWLEGKGEHDFSWFYDSVLYNNSDIKNTYDIFYVDLLNPYADIKDNAALLVDILDWINGLKQNSSEGNILIGHSMGGLIARYALCSMEQNNHTHQTDCYVSYDSPHLGVNVPVGLQYALMDLYTVLYGQYVPGIITYHLFDPLLMYLLECYSCKSAKQMMYYYVDPQSGATNTYHSAWQNELDTIGFPQGDPGQPIENLSIVNGGAYVSTLNPTILDLKIDIHNGLSHTLWLQALSLLAARTNNLDLSFLVSRDSGSGVVCASHASYRKTWPWLSGSEAIVPLLGQNGTLIHSSPSGSQGFDYVDCSYLRFNSLPNINEVSNADTLRIICNDPTFFVPAASAIGVSNYNKDYSVSPPTPKIETPFDSFFIADFAHTHSHNVFEYWDWIVDQRDAAVSGPSDFVLTNDSFSISGLPSTGYSTPVWFASDTTVTVTNGVVNIIHPGNMITIYCKSKKGGAYIYKHRRVMAGFPPMNLQYSHLSGNQYTVTATCMSTDTELRNKLDELANDSTIQFIWGYKDVSTGNYTWTDTTSTRSFICSVPDGQHRFVALKLHNGPGRESSNPNVIHIDRRSTNPFYFEPTEIWSTQQGAMMYYSDLLGTAASSNQYFAVWYNSGYSPAPPSPNNIQVYLETIPLTDTFQTTIDGELTTVYCFDFADALVLPSPSTPQSFGPLLQAITIRHDTTPLQYVLVPVCW